MEDTTLMQRSEYTSGLRSLPQPQESAYKLLLTVDEAARRLSISKSTLYMLITQRRIFTVKVGAARRVPLRALEAYVEALVAGEGAR
jgi:excisionase family DNA binding protein